MVNMTQIELQKYLLKNKPKAIFERFTSETSGNFLHYSVEVREDQQQIPTTVKIDFRIPCEDAVSSIPFEREMDAHLMFRWIKTAISDQPVTN